MVELAEAVLNHVIDRRPDLCGDVGTRVLGQMTDDIVDVGFGERTHGVPSFQSFVMLESSSSHWEWSAAATSAPLAVTVSYLRGRACSVFHTAESRPCFSSRRRSG